MKNNLHIWTQSLPYEPKFMKSNSKPPPPKIKDKSTNTLSYWFRGEPRGELKVFMSNIIGKDATTQVSHEPDPLPPQPQNIVVKNHLSSILPAATMKAIMEPKVRNASCGTDVAIPKFFGFESIISKDMLFNATNVTQEAFDTLLALLEDFKPRSLARKEFLVMFLIKLRHNLPFDLLAMFFDTNRSTLVNSFNKILEILYAKTINSFFLVSEEEVEATMPEGLTYSDSTRVIVDCLQVKNNRTESTDKHKYLIGKCTFYHSYFSKLIFHLKLCRTSS